MTPHSALRALSLPSALLLSLAAHAALIAAILGKEDATPDPPRPGGIIAVEIVIEGPKARPGVEPAPQRTPAPNIPASAPGRPADGVAKSRVAPALAAAPPPPVVPPRARRKPLHLAHTGLPIEKPAAVMQLPAPAATLPQPRSDITPDGLIRATLAARSGADDRGASPRGDNPKPAYPFVARRRGQEGQVLLNVQVLPDGTAGRVEIARSSGFHRLDEAAQHAVARWRFLPARQGGAPVAAMVTVPVRFSLR